MANELTAVSLFAGVGGFDLALTNNGIKVVAAVEIDNNARGVLQHKFPETKLFTDVKEVTGNDLITAGFNPANGIIVGGFPCQDLSVAGKRAGLAGARSGLYWEIVRLAEETQAKWLILENVPGLLSSNKGADMGTVIGTLVECGFSVSWRILDAQYFGVPQRRRRVFIVAGRTSSECVGKVLFESESSSGDSSQSQQAWEDTSRDITEGAGVFGESSFGQYKPGIATLKASGGVLGGGERVIDNRIIGTLCARDYKGVGNQYVDEGKVIVQ